MQYVTADVGENAIKIYDGDFSTQMVCLMDQRFGSKGNIKPPRVFRI